MATYHGKSWWSPWYCGSFISCGLHGQTSSLPGQHGPSHHYGESTWTGSRPPVNMDTTWSAEIKKYKGWVRKCPSNKETGARFNIKMSCQYRKSHCGDETISRVLSPQWDSSTGKMATSYWISPLVEMQQISQHKTLYNTRVKFNWANMTSKSQGLF